LLCPCGVGLRLDVHSFPTRRSSDLDWGPMELWVAFGFGALIGAFIGTLIGRQRAAARATAAPPVTPPPPAQRFAPPEVQHVVLRSEEHTSELQSPDQLVCRLTLQKK